MKRKIKFCVLASGSDGNACYFETGTAKILIDAGLSCREITRRLEIAGVDIIYDIEREEYVVLEVNGLPAFATPEQEEMGLDFNDKKIDKIVDLIDRLTLT